MNYLKMFLQFITNRLLIIFFIFAVLFYVLSARLYDLQIRNGKKYHEDFEKSIVREVFSKGLRGNIYDKYGFPLSENILSYDVYLNDSYEVKDRNEMANKLSIALEKHGDSLIYILPLKVKDSKIIFDCDEYEELKFKNEIFFATSEKPLTDEEKNMSAPDVYKYLRDDLFEVNKKYTDDDFDLLLEEYPDLTKYKFEKIKKESRYKYTIGETMDILNLRYSQFIRRYKKFIPEKIAVNVSEETVASLQENKINFPGITIEESSYRIYNDGEYFSHILGYTREINSEQLEEMQDLGYKADDKIGFVGLEKEFEPYLRGRDGNEKVEVNYIGKTMKVLEDNDSHIGGNVISTIDHNLQIETTNILEQNLADILAENLYYSPPAKRPTAATLKDVFDSIFRYELIDISRGNLMTTDAGEYIVDKSAEMIETYSANVKSEISSEAKGFNNINKSMYYFIFNTLVDWEILKENFYKDPYYDEFLNGRISFYQLMQSLYDNTYLILDLEGEEIIYKYSPMILEGEKLSDFTFEADETLVRKMNELVFDRVLKDRSIHKFYYLYIVNNSMVSYASLCTMIVDLGLVTATDSEYQSLKYGGYSPLYFIRDKIKALELRPKDLALDPSSGAVVIADVKTGEVKALVSYPSYDNNKFVNKFDGEYYNKLREDPSKPLYPRATLSKMVPGSTFKMFSGLAALSDGVTSPYETVYAKGIFEKIYPPARCWIYAYGGAHGNLNLFHALEQSCNYYFYEMAFRMGTKGREDGTYSSEQGIATLNKYLDIIGLSQTTGIELGEAKPSTPKLDPVRGAIGQEQNGYTPVGLARYINVLADNGRVKELNIVDKITDNDGLTTEDFTPKVINEQAFEQEYIDAVKEGMHLVTVGARGTARHRFKDLPISSAGKTGTAEIASFDDKSIDPVKKIKVRPNHALYTAFAPFENPEVTVVVALQYAYDSAYAADACYDVLENYFKVGKEIDDLDYANEFY